MACVLMGAVAARAADLRVCVDTASATAARDRAFAQKAAGQAGLTLEVAEFSSSGDDEGFTPKQFGKLLASRCDLVMGYPVDTSAAAVPAGLLATRPYAQTGFVLVTAPGVAARKLADLPAGTEVAVTFETPPNLYFVEHPNISADIHNTEADTMAAVAGGAVPAAMVWQPTAERWQAGHPAGPKLVVTPLAEAHARFDVVALYLPRAMQAADAVNATKISLTVPAGDAAPALYTAAQAKLGYVKFIGNCAMCHGTHLEGRSGPSLKGPNWANAKANYTVGEVFTVVSQQMPATGPGSLPPSDYVQIMAYLLQQNGYPAGASELQFDKAAASDVKLLYRGG